ncbi:hypothetical protein T484DRAFT_1813751 [Baffinella frigidus]|nr:hypothetical protein T484DRAFT_1813751 [Cryptophyta sp. CCMP2293]
MASANPTRPLAVSPLSLPIKDEAASMGRVTDRPPPSQASGQTHATSSPPTGAGDKRAEQLRLEMVMFAQHSSGDSHGNKSPPGQWDCVPPPPNPRRALGGEDGWGHAARIPSNDSGPRRPPVHPSVPERGGEGRDVRARSDPPPERPPRGDYGGANGKGATTGGGNGAIAGNYTGNVGGSINTNVSGYTSSGANSVASGGHNARGVPYSHTGNDSSGSGGCTGKSGGGALLQSSGAKPTWDARVKPGLT